MPAHKRFKHLRIICLQLVCLALSLCARADTSIEIAPRPLTLDLTQLRALQQADSEMQARKIADAWVHDHGSVIPITYPIRDTSHPAPTTLGAAGPSGAETMSKLIVQVMHFARDVSSVSDSFASNFRAQFLHAIDERFPGFAWVVVAERTGFDLQWLSGYREGGAAGVQIPVLGSKALWVKNGYGQVVLRILPVGGNIESLAAGWDPNNQEKAPGSGLVLRPSAELEATYQMTPFQPGMRFLIQPRLMHPQEARMIAEVYVKIDVATGDPMLTNVSIVPRCMLDFSNDYLTVPDGANAEAFRNGYRMLSRNATCSISAQFAWGL